MGLLVRLIAQQRVSVLPDVLDDVKAASDPDWTHPSLKEWFSIQQPCTEVMG